jgi:DNA helicase-2/ATP-dependent DNA helicase PcrA
LRPILDLAPGDRVTHDAFGLGRVIAIRGEADSTEAEVDFGSSVGSKRLLLRYAPLVKL